MASGAVVQGLAGREHDQARRFRRSCSAIGWVARLGITLLLPHSPQQRARRP
jgi:hypothetical protein